MKYLILLCALLLTSNNYGQFSKYKSRSKFNKRTNSVPKLDVPENIKEERGEDRENDDEELDDNYDDENDVAASDNEAERDDDRDTREREREERLAAPERSRPSRLSSNQDVFGRSKSLGHSAIKKDKNYVNLNPETAFGPEVITSFNFPNTSLTDLTKQMQKLTGINLIYTKDIKGKVSILAPTPITVGDAWKAFLTALEINGYTLVKSGSFYKVVSTRDIRYTPTKIYTGNFTPKTDNYVMRIIPLKNIDSNDVLRSFRPFMSRYGRILNIKQTNTLIVQDTGSNINRLVRLVQFIDVPGHDETLQIIPVKHSSAQEISKLLDEILRGKSSSKRKFRSKKNDQNISRIIAEPRTNSIIAMANAQGAKRLRQLIKRLDVKGLSQNGGRIHVYYLNYGDAEALAKTLSSLVGGSTRSRSSRSSRRLGRRSSTSSAPSTLFSNDVKINADKENNALVVTASPTDYLTLKSVINKLDIPRDQVYVEGLIMETNVGKANEFGISMMGVYGSGGAQKAGFTQGSKDGLIPLLTNQIQSLGGLFAGFGIGKARQVQLADGSEVTVNSVNGLIKAIANNSQSNVLATPQILALDNQEAHFEVGENIPTLEKTTTNGTISESTKQQKVTLSLKITPQINKVTRFVKLKIEQKINDVSDRPLPSGLSNLALATTERVINSTVTVRDKDTIAMGGLMRDKVQFSESKVPLLGDIPLLGWLFKNRSRVTEKVNLLFFLTPRILASYQKDNANQVKDLLNRRGNHLKQAFGEEDPFGTTVKGLYEKADKQEQGPLYEDDRRQFQDTNDSKGIEGTLDEEEALELSQLKGEITPPNYGAILQEIKTQQAGTQKPKVIVKKEMSDR